MDISVHSWPATFDYFSVAGGGDLKQQILLAYMDIRIFSKLGKEGKVCSFERGSSLSTVAYMKEPSYYSILVA